MYRQSASSDKELNRGWFTDSRLSRFPQKLPFFNSISVKTSRKQRYYGGGLSDSAVAEAVSLPAPGPPGVASGRFNLGPARGKGGRATVVGGASGLAGSPP